MKLDISDNVMRNLMRDDLSKLAIIRDFRFVRRLDVFAAPFELYVEFDVDGTKVWLKTMFQAFNYKQTDNFFEKFYQQCADEISRHKTTDFEKWFGRKRKIV